MAFQFKIQLQHIADPVVWRRVGVPEQFTFYKFHLIIQCAFGWENCHLFQFSPKGYSSDPIIGVQHPDAEYQILDSKKIRLQDVFITPRQKLIYIYDFGDDWFHNIVLEKITDEKMIRACCTGGEGTCPPEDCGGPWGYENLKSILENPKHPEYADMKEWLGLPKNKKWNANAFNLKKANLTVNSI
jgi:hypothetical protein